MLRHVRYWGGVYIRTKLRRRARQFLATTSDGRKVQQQVLRRILALNASSRFSHDHHLSARTTLAEFRRHVPVANFEAYRPYIERMKQGDSSALLGRKNRLLMFTLSSGTTAESKFIPITSHFLRDYRRGWQIWGIHSFDAHPRLNFTDIVQLSSDYDQFRTPAGTPCGNISGLVGAMQSKIVQTMYTVPLAISKIKDADAKYYTALRLSVANPNVGLVMTANPSTLVQLAKMADAEKDDLIRDIAEGTLADKYPVSGSIRAMLRDRIGYANPQRARDLEQIAERTGHLYPRDFWRQLTLLGVWTGGSAGAYLNGLKRYYGEVPVRDHGLSASEGRMTIPLEDFTPAGVLDIASHFFEFIPEAEHDTPNPTVLEAHELEEGKSYFILLTTPSGLYRYDICDVVRCVGFRGTTPVLEFLHKGAHFSNITGEKISESQIVQAMRACMDRLGLELSCFTVAPIWGEPPRYRLHVEDREVAALGGGKPLAQALDEQLRRMNCEYEEKRKTGRLDPIEWTPLPAGTWQRFARKRQSRLGGSAEQYKHPCLVPDMKFSEQLLREYALEHTINPAHAQKFSPHHPPVERRTSPRPQNSVVQRSKVVD